MDDLRHRDDRQRQNAARRPIAGSILGNCRVDSFEHSRLEVGIELCMIQRVVVKMTCDVNQIANGRGPRLRIGHLVFWIAGSALGFAAYHEFSPRPERLGMALIVGMYNSVMGMALGTILTGVGIMAYRRWREGVSYRSLPGHWLLIFGVAAALSDGIAIGVFQYVTRLYYPPEK
jgi:hypothetical protein